MHDSMIASLLDMFNMMRTTRSRHMATDNSELKRQRIRVLQCNVAVYDEATWTSTSFNEPLFIPWYLSVKSSRFHPSGFKCKPGLWGIIQIRRIVSLKQRMPKKKKIK